MGAIAIIQCVNKSWIYRIYFVILTNPVYISNFLSSWDGAHWRRVEAQEIRHPWLLSGCGSKLGWKLLLRETLSVFPYSLRITWTLRKRKGMNRERIGWHEAWERHWAWRSQGRFRSCRGFGWIGRKGQEGGLEDRCEPKYTTNIFMDLWDHRCLWVGRW